MGNPGSLAHSDASICVDLGKGSKDLHAAKVLAGGRLVGDVVRLGGGPGYQHAPVACLGDGGLEVGGAVVRHGHRLGPCAVLVGGQHQSGALIGPLVGVVGEVGQNHGAVSERNQLCVSPLIAVLHQGVGLLRGESTALGRAVAEPFGALLRAAAEQKSGLLQSFRIGAAVCICVLILEVCELAELEPGKVIHQRHREEEQVHHAAALECEVSAPVADFG